MPAVVSLHGGIAAVLLTLLLSGCSSEVPDHLRVVDGSPWQGRQLIIDYGCSACHRIPGVRTIGGSVGPNLDGFGRQSYIAGHWPNRPDTLTRWLRDPTALDPDTAMPGLGISAPEARDMAAYLYTLR